MYFISSLPLGESYQYSPTPIVVLSFSKALCGSCLVNMLANWSFVGQYLRSTSEFLIRSQMK
jgi:hypothetical protein